MLSSLVPIFIEKRDPLNLKVVGIDKKQFGIMAGKGTVDAVFVLRRLTEKFRAKKRVVFRISGSGKGF